MPSHPAAFKEWLSGKCFLMDPPTWKVRTESEVVMLVSTWGATFGLAAAALAFLVFGGFFIFMASRGSFDIFGVLSIAAGTCVAALGLGLLGFVSFSCFPNSAKGPYLIYLIPEHTVSLAREGLVVPISEILGLRLVSGNFVGPEGAQKRKATAISELQLIMKGPNGAVAHALVAGMANSDYVKPRAKRLAEAMKMPFEVVMQHQGVSNPPRDDPRSRAWWTGPDN